MKYEETARRLKKAMSDKGLRQQDLADLSGVSKSNISHYVNGKHIPDSFMAYRLAKVLNVDPTWLMGIDEVPDHVVVAKTELIDAIAVMTEPQKERLLNYARLILEEE